MRAGPACSLRGASGAGGQRQQRLRRQGGHGSSSDRRLHRAAPLARYRLRTEEPPPSSRPWVSSKRETARQGRPRHRRRERDRARDGERIRSGGGAGRRARSRERSGASRLSSRRPDRVRVSGGRRLAGRGRRASVQRDRGSLRWPRHPVQQRGHRHGRSARAGRATGVRPGVRGQRPRRLSGAEACDPAAEGTRRRRDLDERLERGTRRARPRSGLLRHEGSPRDADPLPGALAGM